MTHSQQRKAVIGWIRELMRAWAREQRLSPGSNKTWGAFGQVLGARSTANIAGLLSEEEFARISKRIDRINYARVRRGAAAAQPRVVEFER
jgi:uncharacterized sporulation protein YeaH/YhbH (DUF444 family)